MPFEDVIARSKAIRELATKKGIADTLLGSPTEDLNPEGGLSSLLAGAKSGITGQEVNTKGKVDGLSSLAGSQLSSRALNSRKPVALTSRSNPLVQQPLKIPPGFVADGEGLRQKSFIEYLQEINQNG